MRSDPPDAAYELFVGVDIAAATATVAWQTPKQKPSKPLTIEQTPDGFSALQQRLMTTGTTPAQTLLVLEATGIRLPFLRHVLLTAGLCRKSRESDTSPSFCQGLAAAVRKRTPLTRHPLTELAALLQPELWTPPPAIYEELEQRLTR